MTTGSFQSLSQENRKFPPSSKFSKSAHIDSMESYLKLYSEAEKNPDAFWRSQANHLVWIKPFNKVLEWNEPFAKWFVGGQLNASVQCLDKHKNTPVWNKTALIWEGENEDQKRLTYAELSELTNQTAHTLKQLGVKKGDIVTIYMPMVPEAVASMLACARLGAAHSVVFAGFSSHALRDRINDAKSTMVITADGVYRKGKVLPLKPEVDKALQECESVKRVLVLKRTKNEVTMQSARDVWWHDSVANQEKTIEPTVCESEDLLFTLYTSGTTGKPKGIMHTTAGYCLWTQLTTKWVFDIKPEDIYWCTADVGWVTGHSYVVYGPLQLGATVFLYEGAPNQPDWGRFWKMIQKYKITILYTAPTAIRAFMGQGESIPSAYDLSSLRLLGSVGEPINPEAWLWYNRVIGNDKCPIVDTWWQTETGGIMISPLPGATTTKPGSCTLPLPGVFPEIVSKEGKHCKPNEGGYLILKRPWPSMARGIWGDPERFVKTYWSEHKGVYFAGDGARCDQDGYFWVMGRIDDVINVSGHRLGTAEIESALVSHEAVVEAAVVGRPDPMKGQGVVAFVTVEKDWKSRANEKMIEELKAHVTKEIGALARPDEIRFTDSLPKTRSGKIMRRLLKEIATSGVAVGDTTTLEDAKVLEALSSDSED